MKYANIPMTDFASAEPEDKDGKPGWKIISTRDGGERWVSDDVFYGAIHKDLVPDLREYLVSDT